MSLIPPQEPDRDYGMFGYSGAMCDRAIRSDNAPMLVECIERGWIDHNTRMLTGTVLEFCDKRAPKCAEVLRSMAEQ